MTKFFDYWENFRFFTKFLIFLQNFRLFDKIFDFWHHFRFFDKIFDFWQNFRFFTKFSLFYKIFDFFYKISDFLIKFSIFDIILDFVQKFVQKKGWHFAPSLDVLRWTKIKKGVFSINFFSAEYGTLSEPEALVIMVTLLCTTSKKENNGRTIEKNKFEDNCVTSKKLIFSRPPIEQQKMTTF